MGTSASPRLPPTRSEAIPRLLFLVGMPSGAGLVVYLVAGVSLPFAFGFTTLVVVLLAAFVLRMLNPTQRIVAMASLKAGATVGLVATAVYDLSRFGLVWLFSLSANPWEALPHFGALLTGLDGSTATAQVAGFLFHVANGTGFAVAFVVLLGHRGPLAGVAWALGLEVATLTFYPGWLDIRAIQEFATVSMVGHVCFGLTLGYLSSPLLNRFVAGDLGRAGTP